MGIPLLTSSGELPEGEHDATLDEIRERFGAGSETRERLMKGLENAAASLSSAGVKKIWVDGSFVTDKPEPNDVDGCWEYHAGVTVERLDPVFLSESREPMKKKFCVEFFLASWIEGASGVPFPNFFQTNRDGNPKGILVVSLEPRGRQHD